MSEHDEQVALFQWAAWAAERLPGIALLHAIPNGGKRDVVTAARLKAEGVKPGVPDLFLPVARGNFHGFYIELKTATGRTTPAQEEWIERLRIQGYAVAVCRGWVDAATRLCRYLGGLPSDFGL